MSFECFVTNFDLWFFFAKIWCIFTTLNFLILWMSCHVTRKLSNVRLSFWGGAAFLLSLSDGAAVPNSFWVALISPILLWLILLLWSGASFQLPAFGRCCFSSSSFRVVLSSSHPFGWCFGVLLLQVGAAFPASFWVVVIFSFIECFWTVNWLK